MLTDDDYPRRKVRPEPAQTDAKRGLDGLTPRVQAAAPPPPPPPPPTEPDTAIPGLVGDAVRRGYDVINETLSQGRAAADAYGAKQYRLENAATDLSSLGRRLLHLSQDLSTTWFDLVAAAVADPKLHAALRRKDHAAAAVHHPAPQPARPSGPLPVTVQIKGPRTARGEATPLDAGTTRVRPVVRALLPIDPVDTRPPISRVGLIASAGGIVAVVQPADDQPAGTYQGVIADAASGATLGQLTVRVAA